MSIYIERVISLLLDTCTCIYNNSTVMLDYNFTWHFSTNSGHNIKQTLILVSNNSYYLYWVYRMSLTLFALDFWLDRWTTCFHFWQSNKFHALSSQGGGWEFQESNIRGWGSFWKWSFIPGEIHWKTQAYWSTNFG